VRGSEALVSAEALAWCEGSAGLRRTGSACSSDEIHRRYPFAITYLGLISREVVQA